MVVLSWVDLAVSRQPVGSCSTSCPIAEPRGAAAAQRSSRRSTTCASPTCTCGSSGRGGAAASSRSSRSAPREIDFYRDVILGAVPLAHLTVEVHRCSRAHAVTQCPRPFALGDLMSWGCAREKRSDQGARLAIFRGRAPVSRPDDRDHARRCVRRASDHRHQDRRGHGVPRRHRHRGHRRLRLPGHDRLGEGEGLRAQVRDHPHPAMASIIPTRISRPTGPRRNRPGSSAARTSS